MISALLSVLGETLARLLSDLFAQWRRDQTNRELGESRERERQLQDRVRSAQSAEKIRSDVRRAGIDDVIGGLRDNKR